MPKRPNNDDQAAHGERGELNRWADYAGLVGALLVVIVGFSFFADNFFSTATLRTVMNQVPMLLVVSVGMTFVLIGGGIDLSVGSVLALSAGTFGVAVVQGEWPIPIAVTACIGAGALCGLVSGGLVSLVGIPSFIVTLGMLEVARGGAYLATDSRTIYAGGALDWLTATAFLGLSLSVWIAAAVAVSAQAVLSYTPLGRHMVAVGYNEETARLSGVHTASVKWITFVIAGGLSGLGALLYTARLSAADPNAGRGLELEAIAAAVIGGTSLSGGRGSILRTVAGVFIIAILGAGLAQVGAADPTKRVVSGAVIVAAVIADHFRRRK